jgi:hypothetical protein
MKRIQLALIAAALLLPFQPVLADDPPARGEEAANGSGATNGSGAATAPLEGATQTIQIEETPNGAASMEPKDDESPAARSERAFVENIWNSP